jgi:hypothetical protein
VNKQVGELDRQLVLQTLKHILAWLDVNDEPLAAIDINQAIEKLEPSGITILASDPEI